MTWFPQPLPENDDERRALLLERPHAFTPDAWSNDPDRATRRGY